MERMVANPPSPQSQTIQHSDDDDDFEDVDEEQELQQGVMTVNQPGAQGDPNQVQAMTTQQPQGPRLGGGTDTKTWWTGGSNLEPRDRRASIYASRPEEFRALERVESYIKDFKEEDRLGLPTEKAYRTTLTGWIDMLKSHTVQCGLDPIFHIFDGEKELHLLDSWGEVSLDDIDNHVDALTQTGVPVLKDQAQNPGNRHPVCQFDVENVDRTREMIKACISKDFYTALGPKVTKTMTGLHLFFQVMSQLEPATASTAHALLNKIQTKKLTDSPGMDVNQFNIVIKDLVDRITGCCKKKEHLPSDLAQIVAECYCDTQIQDFDLVTIGLINELDEDPTKYTALQVQSKLAIKYDRLVNSDRWPHKSRLQELSEEVGQLKALQRKQNDGGNRTNNNNNNNNGNSRSDSSSRNTPEGNPELFVAPKDGAPEVKNIDGVEHKYCRKCKNRKHGGKAMWRSDKWAHTTSEHLSGKEWHEKHQAERSASPERSVSFADTTANATVSNGSASTLAPTSRTSSPPPQASLRLISSLNVLGLGAPHDDSPRRPDPPSNKMYEVEEEEGSLSPPRHFDEDSAADNCSFVSASEAEFYSLGSDDESAADLSLNFRAGRR